MMDKILENGRKARTERRKKWLDIHNISYTEETIDKVFEKKYNK